MEQNPLDNLVVAQLAKKFSALIEPEISLPCSQGPVTRTYTEPDEFSAQPSTLFFPSDLFSSVFWTKIFYAFFTPPPKHLTFPTYFVILQFITLIIHGVLYNL